MSLPLLKSLRTMSPGRRRRPRQVAFPAALSAQYGALIVGRMARPTLAEIRASTPVLANRRIDTLEPDPITIPELVTLGREIAAQQRPSLLRQVRDVVGLDPGVAVPLADPRELLELWAAENAGLITTLSGDLVAEVRRLTIDAVAGGTRPGVIAERIAERIGVAESRARLIADDQVAKLHSRIVRERQQALGFEEYEWSTSGDERVRPAHAALDGRRFPLGGSGDTREGNPGDAVRCRCGQIAVLPEDFDT